MALVAPKPETRNPLPPGRFIVTLAPERVEDFTDWAAIYFPMQLVTLISAVPHDGKVHATFEVNAPDKVVWWSNLFGLPSNLTDAPRVVAPSVDRAQRAIEKPIETVQNAVEAVDWGSLLTFAALGLLLYWTLQSKGVSHAMR